MKKTYMQPSVLIAIMETASIICGSQDSITSDKGIDYGGVDDNGQKDPASRHYNIWSNEEDEEEGV